MRLWPLGHSLFGHLKIKPAGMIHSPFQQPAALRFSPAGEHRAFGDVTCRRWAVPLCSVRVIELRLRRTAKAV